VSGEISDTDFYFDLYGLSYSINARKHKVCEFWLDIQLRLIFTNWGIVMGMSQRLRLVFLFLLAGLSGCASAPPFPNAPTIAGSSVMVTDRLYDAGSFRVEYPSGWRIVTGPADAPPRVTFVSPDNQSLIVLSTAPASAPTPAPDMRSESRQVTAGGVTLHAVGSAPAADWDAFLPVFERVLSSAVSR